MNRGRSTVQNEEGGESMNSPSKADTLHAMSQGLVLVGGGEPEQYEILGEKELRPIVNVLPNEQDVYCKLEQLVLHPEWIPALKHQGLEYIRRHHDYRKVARQYLEFYNER